MSGAAGSPLRVGIEARDPDRRHGLLGLLAEAGYQAGSSAEDADVLVCDLGPGESPPRESGATLVLLSDQLGFDRDPRFAAVLPRAVAGTALKAALAAVAAGLIVRAPGATLPEPGFHPAEDEAELGLLTPREVEILAAVGEGLSNKAAARRLGISAHTVKFHLEAIFDKLGASSRAEALAKGLRRGLIEL